MKKIIYTLNINNYAPEIREITRPALESYANKIGADIFDITKRKYPEFGVTYEKVQIYDLAKEHKADWNIYLDSDALIHPDFYDITSVLSKDTVCHNAKDFAPNRWKYDKYFLRDGRHIGSGNWLAVASDWCIDLWHPTELTPEEAYANIFPTLKEKLGCTTSEHLIDDYVLSRNIARYGLKVKTVRELGEEFGGYAQAKLLFHRYNIPHEQKVKEMKNVWENWHGDGKQMVSIDKAKLDEIIAKANANIDKELAK